jgi:hypothetical protein
LSAGVTVSLLVVNMFAAYVPSRTTQKTWIPKNMELMRDLSLAIFLMTSGIRITI